MRRLIATPIAILLIFSVTTSIALAGMRVNSISFSASVSLASDATSLADEDADRLDGQQPSNPGKGKKPGKGKPNQGSCAAPCTGLFLHADGFLTGLGKVDELTVIVEATGIPVVKCVNKSGTVAYGHKPPKMKTKGLKFIGETQVTKNGSATIELSTEQPVVSLSASKMGCPSDYWTVSIVSIEFISAKVMVIEDGETLLQEIYTF